MVTKAIIPVAGYGTRRLPITKAVEKCMMPIGNRPAVDYIVQDAIAAGIRDIYFVVNKDDTQIERYYMRNQKLENYLQGIGANEYLNFIQPPQGVNFYYIDQDVSDRYGNAIPIGLCFPYIKPGESVAILTGNDFIFNSDGSSELAKLISQTPEGASSLLTLQIDPNQSSSYNVIEFDMNGNYYRTIKKPTPSQAPSNYINVNKYIFSYELLQAVAAYSNVNITGEYDVLEPIHQYAITGGLMKIVSTNGYYLNVDDPYSWLYANQIVINNQR